MITFTDAVHRAVRKRGADYVYPGASPQTGAEGNVCRYVVDGRPGCIVGAALVELGVSTSVIRQFEGKPASAVLKALTDLADAERNAADSAQIEQDNGHTWGEALHAYERRLRSGY